MKIHKTHILLVESHDDTVEMLRLYLGYANYQVTAISACGECLKLARTERFNLYLLGDCCEDGDAFELCQKFARWIRTHPSFFARPLPTWPTASEGRALARKFRSLQFRSQGPMLERAPKTAAPHLSFRNCPVLDSALSRTG